MRSSDSGAGLTLRADFFGPGHEEVAGILHDPRAGPAGQLRRHGPTSGSTRRGGGCLAADYLAGSGVPARLRNGRR